MTMPISRDAKLAALLQLPWTIDIQQSEEGYIVARCREVPGSLATGSPEEIEAEFWESLRESLACLVDAGDDIPLPRGITELPWEQQLGLPPVFPDAARVTETRTGVLGSVPVADAQDAIAA
jgi:hypothetical protein